MVNIAASTALSETIANNTFCAAELTWLLSDAGAANLNFFSSSRLTASY
jgi:hypothetical protein